MSIGAALAASALALLLPTAASAHAVLLRTEPSNDNIVQQQPRQVTLRFSEPVESAFGSIRVYDSSAKRLDDGEVRRPDDKTVTVGIDGPLERGTYTVTWRVLSADSHPVHGAFVFHHKAPGVKPGGIAASLNLDPPRSVSVGLDVARFLDFALLLLLAGGAGALLWALASAPGPVRRRLGTVLVGAAVGLAVVALAGIVLEGGVAGGFSLGDSLRWSVFNGVLETRFGKVWLAQAVAAAVLAGLALVVRQRGDRWAGYLTAGLAIALLATPGLAGHAHTAGGAALVADVIHLAAGAAWTGGLLFLVLALIWAAEDRWPLASRAVPRFSTLAVVSVVALIGAGTVSAYLEVKAWRGLWDTTYGLLLLAKIALVVPLLALGAYNNRFAVPRLRAGVASVIEQRRFLRTAGIEVLLMVAIVAVTAVLVSEAPAKAFVAPSGPVAVEKPLGPLDLNLVVDPAKAGSNAIHLYLLKLNGQPATVSEANLSASLPSRRIGPLRFTARRLAPGHYAVYGADLAIPGDWQLRVDARQGQFQAYTTTLSIPVREG
ncbi:MAG: copper resistance CopC/CopD family protein [Solirubrobacteraceae bacterium]